MAIRKDANTLTAAERTEFVAAIQALKAEGIYDQFVLRHANASMGATFIDVLPSCPGTAVLFLISSENFSVSLATQISAYPTGTGHREERMLPCGMTTCSGEMGMPVESSAPGHSVLANGLSSIPADCRPVR